MTTTIKCPKCGEVIEISEDFKAEVNLEVAELKKALQEKDTKMQDFRDQELELREKTRKLEEEKKDLEITTQRRLDEEKQKVVQETLIRADSDHHLKDLEKDKKLSDMEKLVEDLKRKAQQGSMQTQGEVAELDLEETLKRLFPTDEIMEVKKGELGGDVRQMVRTVKGTECGTILWERKRTKVWSEGWVSKLKEDIHRDSASLGAIVTEVLPKDFKKQIGEKSGVWITTSDFVEPLAMLLRKVLYDVAKEKSVKSNKQTKAEELYDFATSLEFVQQVERMVEIYAEMAQEISKERASAERQWKQREMQVNRLLTGVSGIYGSLQGIAGPALPSIKQLDAGE